MNAGPDDRTVDVLTPSQIPDESASWDDIQDFALSFNGYAYWGSFERCAEIANSGRAETVDELRTCLFFEQRRWRHVGEPPDENAMAYIRGLLGQIRAELRRVSVPN